MISNNNLTAQYVFVMDICFSISNNFINQLSKILCEIINYISSTDNTQLIRAIKLMFDIHIAYTCRANSVLNIE